MNKTNPLTDNWKYGRDLATSAVRGADHARRALSQDHPVLPEITRAARGAWQPAVLGSCVGALVAYLTDNRRSGKTAFAGAMVGAAVGFTGGVLWGSRTVTGPMAQGALKQINEARDRRWLEKNPVVYG